MKVKCSACHGTGLAPGGWLCQQCHGNCFTKDELNKALGPRLTRKQYLESLRKQHATKHHQD